MPLPTVPDWLIKRDGAFTPGIRDHVLFVTLSGHPQYRLEARPAKGKYACYVAQANSGKLIDDATAEYPTREAAMAGGLDRLKARLGW
jgi:hypothetical protein